MGRLLVSGRRPRLREKLQRVWRRRSSSNQKGKKLSVHKVLQDNRWITHILPLQTAQEVKEDVMLWEQVGGIHQLEENREDTIRWHWTNNIQPKVHMVSNLKALMAS